MVASRDDQGGRAKQILESRGAPVVEVALHTNKAVHRASAAEADAGREAEKRRLLAKAVADALRLINGKVLDALGRMDPQIDHAIMDLDKAQHKVHHPYPQPFLFSTSVVNRILHCEALCGNNFSSAYHVS
jgi:4-hydroxyphenylpyruvate dioxygenase-like putative hemolysin